MKLIPTIRTTSMAPTVSVNLWVAKVFEPPVSVAVTADTGVTITPLPSRVSADCSTEPHRATRTELGRIPVSRALRSSPTRRWRRSSSTPNAARPRCFLSCCRSFVRGSALLVAESNGSPDRGAGRAGGLLMPWLRHEHAVAARNPCSRMFAARALGRYWSSRRGRAQEFEAPPGRPVDRGGTGVGGERASHARGRCRSADGRLTVPASGGSSRTSSPASRLARCRGQRPSPPGGYLPRTAAGRRTGNAASVIGLTRPAASPCGSRRRGG